MMLKLVLTDHWFEEIRSGRKTHEYRKATPYWQKRLLPLMLQAMEAEKATSDREWYPPMVVFQKAYRKNAPVMIFLIRSINRLPTGINTDLNVPDEVYDIELGPQDPHTIFISRDGKRTDYSNRVVRAYDPSKEIRDSK